MNMSVEHIDPFLVDTRNDEIELSLEEDLFVVGTRLEVD